MIRFLMFIALAAVLGYVGATVKLGNKTFFGHVRAIWHTEEMQDLKHGVEEKAGPAVHRVGHGISAGVKALDDDKPAATGDAGVDAAAARTL